MPIVSEKPLIEILSPEEQHDRFDINYSLPEFIDAEKSLESSSTPLTKLGEIMENDASYGVLPPSSCYLEDEGGILSIRSSNINNEGIDYEDAIRVPSEWLDSERARTGGTTRYRFATDDFLGLRLPKVPLEIQKKVLTALIEIENEADAVRAEKEGYTQNCRKNEQRVLSNLLHLSEDRIFQFIQKRISEALQ